MIKRIKRSSSSATGDDYRRAFAGLQIPMMMAAGPLTGYYIGYALDKLFHTNYLNWVFLILVIYPTFIIISKIVKETTED